MEAAAYLATSVTAAAVFGIAAAVVRERGRERLALVLLFLVFVSLFFTMVGLVAVP